MIAALVLPTVTLSSPTSGAMLAGKVTLSATAEDNPGGTGATSGGTANGGAANPTANGSVDSGFASDSSG